MVVPGVHVVAPIVSQAVYVHVHVLASGVYALSDDRLDSDVPGNKSGHFNRNSQCFIVEVTLPSAPTVLSCQYTYPTIAKLVKMSAAKSA